MYLGENKCSLGEAKEGNETSWVGVCGVVFFFFFTKQIAYFFSLPFLVKVTSESKRCLSIIQGIFFTICYSLNVRIFFKIFLD